LVLLTLLPSHLAASSPPGAASPAYRQALESLARRRFADGIKNYYKFVILHNPALSDEVRKADLAAARDFLQGFLRRQPQDKKAQFFLSLVERLQLRWESANAMVERLHGQHPRSYLLTFVRGEFLLAQDRFDEGLARIAKVREIPQGARMLPLVEFLEKRFGDRQQPENRREILLQQAIRHIDLLERPAAWRVLEQARREFPDDLEAVRLMVDLALETGDLDRAEKTLQEWARQNQRPALTPVQESRLRYAQHRFADVIKILTPVAEREPGNEFVLQLLAESHFQMGDRDRAAGLFERLLTSQPKNLGVLLRLCLCLEMQGKRPAARAHLARTLENDPGNEMVRMEMASLYERARDYDEALIVYQQVVRINGPLAETAARKVEELEVICANQTAGARHRHRSRHRNRERRGRPAAGRLGCQHG
jgi:tetratricopeptide (TPR) repeat protein